MSVLSPGRTAALAALLAAGLAAGAAGLADAGEYREDLPAVLDDGDAAGRAAEGAALDPSAAEIAADFRNAYAQAGRPRIAVFWNRALSDRLSQWVASGRLLIAREVRTDTERDDASATLSWQRNQAGAEPGRSMGALADAEFEAGFTAPMLEAGARLVDRATIMRVTESNSRRSAGHDRAADAQLVETEALKAFADYVAEITMLPDADAPGDRAFRVRVKRIPDGLVAASLVARGQPSPEPGRSRWVATSDGYARVSDARVVRADELGRAVALQTMQALSRAWP